METPSRFIVVDDDPTNNFICKVSINKFFGKSDVLLFEKPEVALEFIHKEYEAGQRIRTVLFLDINMPSMTGWDFLEHFKKFSDQIKQQFVIYILSSSVDQRDKERVVESNFASGYLSKPLLENTLSTLFHD